MKKAIIAALLGSSFTSLAGGFTGLYIQGGAGFIENETVVSKLKNIDSHYPAENTSTRREENIIVTAGYSQSLGMLNLAANVFYIINPQSSGVTYNSVDYLGVSRDLVTKNKQNNTIGVAVEPGINITESTLAYLKLAILNTRHSSEINTTALGINDRSTASAVLKGLGYGVGIKQLLGEHLYIGAEVMATHYDTYCDPGRDNICFKPQQVAGFVTLGYTFPL